MVGELHRTFRFPDDDRAPQALAKITADVKARRGAACSVNLWSETEDGERFITILAERSGKQALAMHGRTCREFGGVEAEAPAVVIEAQRAKRARGIASYRDGDGPEIDVQEYGRNQGWFTADGRIDPR